MSEKGQLVCAKRVLLEDISEASNEDQIWIPTPKPQNSLVRTSATRFLVGYSY